MDDAAEEDLRAVYAYIAEQSDEITAFNYIRRILEWCRSLETFPMRGASREDIREGLRIAGFERRVSIGFAVTGDTVKIVRILYGGRDLSTADFLTGTEPTP